MLYSKCNTCRYIYTGTGTSSRVGSTRPGARCWWCLSWRRSWGRRRTPGSCCSTSPGSTGCWPPTPSSQRWSPISCPILTHLPCPGPCPAGGGRRCPGLALLGAGLRVQGGGPALVVGQQAGSLGAGQLPLVTTILTSDWSIGHVTTILTSDWSCDYNTHL